MPLGLLSRLTHLDFERMVIEDDGHGMEPEAVAHLLMHIGGSAKRNSEGARLHITSKTDPSRSPGGRKLIGKIGIGLFSVSQLTNTFQIVTKVKGHDYRTIATVALKQYSDDEDAPEDPDGKKFELGRVHIWREKASDKEAHGTTITLTSIRPQARDTLRSREIWAAVDHVLSQPEDDERQSIEPPRFHIGRVDASGNLLARTKTNTSALPWTAGDAPDIAFNKLVQSVWHEIGELSPNPQLDRIFDYYLRMVWQLSLAIPLPYVEGHLFDESLREWAQAFSLSKSPEGVSARDSAQ